MFEIFARARFEWERVHLFWVDERAVPIPRITLLPGVLMAARYTAFLVAGSDETAARVPCRASLSTRCTPPQIASGHGTVWFVDTAAAQDTH